MTIEKILVIDDELSVRKSVESHLRRERYSVSSVGSLSEGESLLRNERFDLLFLDLCLPDGRGVEFLERIVQTPGAPVVVILSACTSVGEAIGCIRSGAFDYILKPVAEDELDLAIQRAEADRHKGAVFLPRERDSYGDGEIPGDSPEIQHLRALIQKVAPTDASVLIVGESGVEKERVAEALHAASSRANGPLIKVNCAAVADEQMEGELFGREREVGWGERLDLAYGGTILLEEVSELPVRSQVRLLRVLQEHDLERSPCGDALKLNVRVIATTQHDLSERVTQGMFRQDLFFRLNVFPLSVPSLRERISDLPCLVHYYLEKLARCNGWKAGEISEEALRHLMAYPWPGNVLELENVLERAVILSGFGGRIEADVFEFLHGGSSQPYGHRQIVTGPSSTSSKEPLLTLDELEKQHVLRALEYTNQNRTRAAGLLKISVRTLRNKLHQYRAEAQSSPGCRQSYLPMVSPVAKLNRGSEGGVSVDGIRLPK